MPPRNWNIRITDILEAIARIERYTAGMNVLAFERDEKTMDAVIRNFTIIGEAAARVPESLRKQYSAIPWDKMIGMRNFLVHEYFGITISVIWTTAQHDIPALLPLLKQIPPQVTGISEVKKKQAKGTRKK